MDKEAVQMMSFELVAHAGEATAHFTDAIKYAREGDFEAVDREIKAGDAEILEAHHAQTDLLRCEVTGEDIDFSLLLVHAQDHLMTTIVFERVAKELIEVYRELRESRHAE